MLAAVARRRHAGAGVSGHLAGDNLRGVPQAMDKKNQLEQMISNLGLALVVVGSILQVLAVILSD